MLDLYVSNVTTDYINSNKAYYNKIAQEYYNQIADGYYSVTSSAMTEEQYNNAVSTFCNKWKRELTNNDVLNYFLESGEMEPETIEEIKKFYVENAEPFQKVILDAGLKNGKRYTLVHFDSIGFPVAHKITLIDVEPCQYAQYTDAIVLFARMARKRSNCGIYFYNCPLIIYEGWRELPKDLTEIKVSENTYKSKYASFDKRYLEDCMKLLGEPVVAYDI